MGLFVENATYSNHSLPTELTYPKRNPPQFEVERRGVRRERVAPLDGVLAGQVPQDSSVSARTSGMQSARDGGGQQATDEEEHDDHDDEPSDSLPSPRQCSP